MDVGTRMLTTYLWYSESLDMFHTNDGIGTMDDNDIPLVL